MACALLEEMWAALGTGNLPAAVSGIMHKASWGTAGDPDIFSLLKVQSVQRQNQESPELIKT